MSQNKNNAAMPEGTKEKQAETISDNLHVARKLHQLVIMIAAGLLLLALAPNRAAQYQKFALEIDSIAPRRGAYEAASELTRAQDQYTNLLDDLSDTVMRYIPSVRDNAPLSYALSEDIGMEMEFGPLSSPHYAWLYGERGTHVDMGARLASVTVGELASFYRAVDEIVRPQPSATAVSLAFRKSMPRGNGATTNSDTAGKSCEIQPYYSRKPNPYEEERRPGMVIEPEPPFDAGWWCAGYGNKKVAIKVKAEDDAALSYRLIIEHVFADSNSEVTVKGGFERRKLAIDALDTLRTRFPGIWSEFRDVAVKNAVVEARARARAERQSLALFGFSVDASRALVSGPLLLCVVLAVLWLHLRYCVRAGEKWCVRLEFAWFPLIPDRLAAWAGAVLLLVLPAVGGLALGGRALVGWILVADGTGARSEYLPGIVGLLLGGCSALLAWRVLVSAWRLRAVIGSEDGVGRGGWTGS